MTDVFADWKDKKFVVSPNYITETFISGGGHIIVLTDVTYWNNNYHLLQDWCTENQSKIAGMTVEVPDEQRLMLFALRWA